MIVWEKLIFNLIIGCAREDCLVLVQISGNTDRIGSKWIRE